MWFRLLELLYSPFLLFIISYNAGNKSSEFQRSTPAPNTKPSISDASECPMSNERGVSVLFYDHHNPDIRGCYEKEGQGPCGENMKLYPVNETRTGECDCDMASDRILLYHSKSNQCYPIFQQGYCKTGEQLVITQEKPLVPVCQRTACYDTLKMDGNLGKDFVPVRNNTACVEVGSSCGVLADRMIIGFKRNKVTPSCVYINNRSRAIGAPSVGCSPGTYRAISGHCQPPIFSFDDWE